MPFHIPFEHRQKGTPIYIGFDAPQPVAIPVRRKKAWNWWAFFGFPMSLFALIFTSGVLSPVALVFNLVGLRKRPRKLATAGTVISLIGTLLVTGLIVGSVGERMHRQKTRRQAAAQRLARQQILETRSLMSVASEELTEIRDNDSSGHLPEAIEANMLMIKHSDNWGQLLRYDELRDGGLIRSAGPDTEFDTSDDLTLKVKGKTHREALLPVD